MRVLTILLVLVKYEREIIRKNNMLVKEVEALENMVVNEKVAPQLLKRSWRS